LRIGWHRSGDGRRPMAELREEELLIGVIAGMLQGLGHVAVGAASPVPGAAALLARRLSGGRLRVSILGSEAHSSFTDGSRELFDCAGQGRIDAFFLGGVQIDGAANVNLVGPGPYPKTEPRFPGSFGAAYLYYTVPRVILFRQEHSPRSLVERVDFVTAPGTSLPEVYRPGGPYALVTGRCVFAFDREKRRFRLERCHPGHDLAEIRRETGFDFDVAPKVAQTAAPAPEALALMRGVLIDEIAEVYPQFAARLAA